jgi:hypothetical protein
MSDGFCCAIKGLLNERREFTPGKPRTLLGYGTAGGLATKPAADAIQLSPYTVAGFSILKTTDPAHIFAVENRREENASECRV